MASGRCTLTFLKTTQYIFMYYLYTYITLLRGSNTPVSSLCSIYHYESESKCKKSLGSLCIFSLSSLFLLFIFLFSPSYNMWPYNCPQFSKGCTKFSYESPINYAWNSVDRYICDSGKDDEMRNIQEVRLLIYLILA